MTRVQDLFDLTGHVAIVTGGGTHHPLARSGTPDDVKGAVALLASEAGAWITGHNLVVDGGWSAW